MHSGAAAGGPINICLWRPILESHVRTVPETSTVWILTFSAEMNCNENFTDIIYYKIYYVNIIIFISLIIIIIIIIIN